MGLDILYIAQVWVHVLVSVVDAAHTYIRSQRATHIYISRRGRGLRQGVGPILCLVAISISTGVKNTIAHARLISIHIYAVLNHIHNVPDLSEWARVGAWAYRSIHIHEAGGRRIHIYPYAASAQGIASQHHRRSMKSPTCGAGSRETCRRRADAKAMSAQTSISSPGQ